MEKKFKVRLLKLVDHLKSGELGHKRFDFNNFNRFDNGVIKPYSCGTAGCAIGECPVLFPNQWKFDYFGTPMLRGTEIETNYFDFSTESAKVFFGLEENEMRHLFLGESQNVELYGGKHLGYKATRKQVANNILAFIKEKESNE